jgi:ribonuclease HI
MNKEKIARPSGEGADPAGWQRKRFKNNKVWMAVDQLGAPLRKKNKVLIKYQLDQPHEYWVHAASVEDIESEPPRYVEGPSERPRKTAVTGRCGVKMPGKAPSSPPKNSRKPRVVIYTDGASSGNPGPSGIGIRLQYGAHVKEISRYIGHATNNIAELLAVKEALEAVHRKDLPVRLHTDSSYVHGLLTKGWKAHKNRDLVDEIRLLASKFENLELIKVAGHAGEEGNERADYLATSAIEKRK